MKSGPVANEYKEVLWNRFKEASSRINKQHQEFFENIKQEQLRNLELKSELCVKAEELAQQPLTSRKEWNKASEKLFEIQKVWKTIGFAPKKDNNAIYERFRNACDKFFEAKRAYYAGLKGEMEHNLQLKTELCEAAEALRDSEEWKKTTDELIALQAKWKQTGAVSRAIPTRYGNGSVRRATLSSSASPDISLQWTISTGRTSVAKRLCWRRWLRPIFWRAASR